MKNNGLHLPCTKCRTPIDQYKEEQILDSGNKYRIKATCPHCGAYIKWLAFLESNLSPDIIAMMENHNYARSYKKVL